MITLGGEMFWKSGGELALWYLMSDGLPAGPPLGHALKISPITIVGAAWVGERGGKGYQSAVYTLADGQ